MTTMAKMNKGVGKWVVRFLLVLLIASFAMWGTADWVTGVQNPVVAEVGDQEIDAYTFSNEAQNRLQLISQQTGRQITPQIAMQARLYDQILNGMIDQRTLSQKITDLGLAVPVSTVRDLIVGNPRFRDEAGKFSRNQFEFFLSNQRMSEAGYVAALRSELAMSQYLASLGLGLERAPRSIANALYDYQAEKRSAAYIIIPNDKLAEIAEPSEEQLVEYHKENAATYTAPEYRSADVLVVTTADLAAQAEVSEQEVTDRYEARQDQYKVEEKRNVLQMIFDGEDDAKKAAASLGEGKAFAAVAKELLDMEVADAELGLVGRGDLLDGTADKVFALDKGGISAPVESGFGWHVFQVTDIQPGRTSTLAEVSADIRKDLQLEKAGDLLFDVSNEVQDEVAGGATVAEVAEKLKLKLSKIGPVSAGGQDPAGKALAVPMQNEVLPEIFAVEADQEPEMKEDRDGTAIYVVGVTDVTAPALRPLDSVRSDVVAQWKKQTLAKAAEDKLAKLREEAQSGTTLDAIADRLGVETAEAKGFTRSLGAADIPAAIREKLFSADAGAVVDGAAAGNEAKLIAKLTAVTEADREQGKEVITRIVGEYGTSFARDVDQALRQALRTEFDVSIDHEAMVKAADPTFGLQQ